MTPHVAIDSGRRPYFPCYASDELSSPKRHLPGEIRGMLEDFRKAAWAEEGLENDELYLLNIAKELHWTRAKFFKFWPILSQFFTEKNGFLYYTDDEKHASKQRDVSSKRKIAGALGGKRKHENWSALYGERLANASKPPPLPIPSPIPFATPSGTEVLTNGREEPPPPSSAEVEVFPFNSSTPLSSPVPVTDSEVQALEQHCRNLNLSPPGRKLCNRLKQKFHPLPVAQFVQQLPRFENQNSPGLWADPALTPRILAEEAERQKNPPPAKKPVKAEPKSPYISVWDLEAQGT